MRVKFVTSYKSIRSLPAEELPNFCVITGANGSGKTQFLEAIGQGSLTVDSLPPTAVQYYNWSTLAPVDEPGLVPRAVSDQRNQAWKAIEQQLAQLCSTGRPRAGNPLAWQEADLSAAIQRWASDHSARDALKPTLEAASDELLRRMGGAYNVRSFQEVARRLATPLVCITEDQFYEECPLVIENTNPFHGALSKLFASYVRTKELNDLRQLRAGKGDTSARPLTDGEFLDRWGEPPWISINRLFEHASLDFRVEPPRNLPTRTRQFAARDYCRKPGLLIQTS